MTVLHFNKSEHDPCVYTRQVLVADYVYFLLYVDDMLIAAREMSEVKFLKDQLSSEFEMKNLGVAMRILGMDIERDRTQGILKLSQSEYLKKVITTLRMEDTKLSNTPIGAHFKLADVRDEGEEVNTEITPYLSTVGSIMYAMVGTRHDLAYGIGLVSQFMSKVGQIHWEYVKWLLRYIKGSLDLKLVYTKEKEMKIHGYSGIDYASDWIKEEQYQDMSSQLEEM